MRLSNTSKTLHPKKVICLKIFLISVIIMSLFIAVLGFIYINKIKITYLFAEKYEVQGVDVSHYQGNIDWDVLYSQGIDFAYIKATEGSSHVDTKFDINWENASKTEMKIGAYHFFSFDSEGKTQAQNYIEIVGNLEGKLIPVVDVEYYGDKKSNPPAKEEVVAELKDMLQILEKEYDVKPMIYTTYTVYFKYLKNEFDDYPLWIRDVYIMPNILIGNIWTMWQYSDTSTLNGYSGAEKYIDRDVFYGKVEDLENYTVQKVNEK